MKILYFDCFAGGAGDMILGALLDAGLPLAALREALGSLAIDGWDVRADRVVRGGIQATKFRVLEADRVDEVLARDAEREHHHPHPHRRRDEREEVLPEASHGHRTVAEIKAAIDRSNLSPDGKARAKALFDRLATAEAAIHGMSVNEVHLHEVGALDSIIDVVGAVFALEWFGADRIVVSPMNVGGGMVTSAHGVFPVPAPATLRLLGDAPIYSSGIQKELLTPTGALLLTSYASSYGPVPAMRLTATGYGAGERDLPGTPNVMRVLVGEHDETSKERLEGHVFNVAGDVVAPHGGQAAMTVSVIECEIDDMNPQLFGPLMDRLYAVGALDVFYTPIQMKKNRPATLVTVVTSPARRPDATRLLFEETTTIGLRHHETARECLAREMVTVVTPVGDVRFKIARHADRVVNAQPEFDDLVRLAGERRLPIKEVQAIAHKAWLDRARE